jgi:hypothetical protein
MICLLYVGHLNSYQLLSHWLLDKLAGKTTYGIQLRCVKEADHEFLDTSRLIGSQTLPNRLKGSNETIRLDVWVWGNEGSPSWDQSVGLLIGITKNTEREGCPMNALIFASNRLTVCSHHVKLVLNGCNIALHITGICILGHQFERHPLPASGDHHGNMGLLHPFGLVDRAANLVIVSLKGGLLPPRSTEPE